MLKQRIITALILAPIVLAGVFLLPLVAFSFFIGLILLIGSWEWAGLAGFEGRSRFVYPLVLLPFMLAAWYLPPEPILLAGLIWWVLALYLVVSYGRSTFLFTSPWSKAVIGLFVLIPPWIGLIQLKQQADSHFLILLLFFLIWGADIGAYFAGRALGRRKLAPRVSPGKSWEGVVGGMLAAIVIFLLMDGWRLGAVSFSADKLWFLCGCVLIVCLSVIGDLTESLFKRERGVKDSSQLLPGHGGVMDRIDSLVAASPVFALLVQSLW